VKLVIIAVLILSGCSDMKLRNHEVDPEFKEYVDQFLVEMNVSRGDVAVLFDDYYYSMGDRAIGVCSSYDNTGNGGSKWKAVFIRRSHWVTITKIEKELLIKHELGHCLLDIDGHRNDYAFFDDDLFCPTSIMNAYAMSKRESETCYVNHRDYYIKEMRGY